MVISRTPLRVSFLGGNTDFKGYYSKHGGLVVTTAIDKYVYCIVKKRFDDLIIVNYSRKEEVDKVDDLQHELVREAMKLTGVTKGVEISFMSDVPSAGSGLGSSSAVTVGVLNALHHYQGEIVGAEQLAYEAVEIEVEILKKPIGIQDQYIVALGGLRWISFGESGYGMSGKLLENGSLRDDFNNSLMLFYTGITRKSENILKTLDIEGNKKLLDENKRLAEMGIDAIRKDKFILFGNLLDEYWKTKQKLSDKISNSDINAMYEKSMLAGAIGGKIIGAGGGGFLLLMVPDIKRDSVRQQLRGYKELPFRIEPGGTKVIFNIGR